MSNVGRALSSLAHPAGTPPTPPPCSELSAWQRIIYRQIQRFGGVASDTNSEAAGGSMRGVSNIIMQL